MINCLSMLETPLNIIISALVFIASALLTKMMIRINISAIPLERSSHTHPTPTAGGVGIILSFLVGLNIFVFLTKSTNILYYHSILHYTLAAVILAIVSLYDDCKPLSYRFRIAIHILCAALVVIPNFQIEFPALNLEMTPTVLQAGLAILALVSLMNATNFIDGLDGLLSGTFLVSLPFSALVLLPTDSSILIVYSLLFAAVLGFLIFNFPKAKIFIGDIGSTFLGLTIGFLALFSQYFYPETSTAAIVHRGFIFTLCPLSFIWFDVFFTLCRRIYLGRKLTEAHRDHLAQLLHRCGYTHPQVSSLYFMVTTLAGFLTVFCHWGIISFINFFMIYAFFQSLFAYWVFSQTTKYKIAT